MADLIVAGTSGYATGSIDTASTVVNNVTATDAVQPNGLAAAIIQIETVLGTGTTLKGAYADLVTRLATPGYYNYPIPAGTLMLFVQTAAPTGWTKSTTHNDKALRVVSGTASTGGSIAFTTAFAAGTIPVITDSHTLSSTEMPAHAHPTSLTGGAGSFLLSGATGRATSDGFPTGSTGGGGGHTHGITSPSLAVNYVDVIIATKD